VQLSVIPPIEGASMETIALRLSPDDVRSLHELGWRPPFDEGAFDPLTTLLSADGNPLRAVAMGFRETRKLVSMTYLTLYRLFQRTVGVDQLRGPVGIVHLGTAVVDHGWPYMLFFLAMISVNLAVLNFLPLPIVDGGLFLYLVYEKIRGEPPSIAFQNVATMAGLFLIVGIFVMTFFFDMMRLVG
jgi:regulator of sigma E protease